MPMLRIKERRIVLPKVASLYPLVKAAMWVLYGAELVCRRLHFERGRQYVGILAAPLVTYAYREQVRRCGPEWYLREDC